MRREPFDLTDPQDVAVGDKIHLRQTRQVLFTVWDVNHNHQAWDLAQETIDQLEADGITATIIRAGAVDHEDETWTLFYSIVIVGIDDEHPRIRELQAGAVVGVAIALAVGFVGGMFVWGRIVGDPQVELERAKLFIDAGLEPPANVPDAIKATAQALPIIAIIALVGLVVWKS